MTGTRAGRERPESPPPNLPKFDAHRLFLYFWENWAVIRHHCIFFGLAVSVAVIFGGYVIRQFNAKQIDVLQADNNLLKDHNSTLQQNAATVPTSQWRHLSDQERSAVIAGLKSWANKPKEIAIYALAESESRQYAAQFIDIFRSLGIESRPIEVSLSAMSIDVGLMVGVQDIGKPSLEAQDFFGILNSAGLKVHFTPWGKFGNEPGDFDIFIGPKPW